MKLRTTAAVGGLLTTALLSFAAPASAAGYDPNVARVANPAQACKSIPGSVQNAAKVFGVEIDTSSFDYTACVQTLAHGAAFVPGFGSPYEQCDFLVSVGAVSYPSTLHDATDNMEDLLLPDLTIRNRKECGSALYAYHSIVSFFPEGP